MDSGLNLEDHSFVIDSWWQWLIDSWWLRFFFVRQRPNPMLSPQQMLSATDSARINWSMNHYEIHTPQQRRQTNVQETLRSARNVQVNLKHDLFIYLVID